MTLNLPCKLVIIPRRCSQRSPWIRQCVLGLAPERISGILNNSLAIRQSEFTWIPAPEPMPSVVDAAESSVNVPTLLVELPPWHRVFRRNLADLLWRRHTPPLRLASKPADFWPDVFVHQPLPWGKFAQSVVYHATALALLWSASLLLPRTAQISERPTFSHEDVIYYSASDLLPPLDTGDNHPPRAAKGDPTYAPQPIISVPPEADNRRQTIVTPPQLKLNRDVPLPNVVSWPKIAPQVPIAATQPASMAERTPTLDMPAVAPAPDVKLASSRQSMQNLASSAVAPAPVVDAASTLRVGDLNIGHTAVVAPAPQLAVAEQRVAAGRTGLGNSKDVVPPPPSVSGSAGGASSGRLIALSIHPGVAAPVEPPAGNRRGSFSAGPQGKPGAAGTPDIAGSGRGTQNSGGGGHTEVPPGLHVGAGPDAKTNAIGGSGHGNGTGGGSGESRSPALMAKLSPPRVSSRPEGQVPNRTAETEEEEKVFGDRKFYSMTLNIPNLNSAGGSWVIHFAEKNGADDKGELSAPTATTMVDPAYPLELMNQHVQGTVTLYAVIGSDGAVSDVRVLNSADDRLDQYAREALMRWHFRPASKNGSPVPLEAVVKIPFRASRRRSSF